MGQLLFNDVVQKLGLLEADYFDLEYTDVHGVHVSTTSCFYPPKSRVEIRRKLPPQFQAEASPPSFRAPW